MPKITHLTSVHPRFDTRIFHKMCTSLKANNYEVTLVVADGKKDEVLNGVSIFDVGSSKSRRDRMMNAPARVLAKALELNSDLYHLHDPELIPIGLKLKRLGKRVIFDSHEDVPKQILSKDYLSKPVRWVVSRSYSSYEARTCRKLDAIIAATPVIRDKFLSINKNTLDVNNFPLLHELENQTSWTQKKEEVCYVGGISQIRGIQEVCTSMGLVRSNTRLNLVGDFNVPSLQEAVSRTSGWQKVNSLGFLDRKDVKAVLERSVAGLVTFHPLPNHIHAQPNKMFEYMSAGIPVIASDFPLWREIIEGNNCGLLVDPLDPSEIAQAIDTLVSNPEMAKQMGENGRKAVETKYNWTIEESKLLRFYEDILNRNSK